MADLISLLRDAIASRTDFDTGLVLSGGLDSSTVACLASRPMLAFTGFYDVAGFDERPYARLAAAAGKHSPGTNVTQAAMSIPINAFISC